MEFSERLKKLRKDTGLTQVDVASKLGISQQAYASWERGIKKPTQENLVKLSKILEDIELLFRMNSKGLSNEEKEIFRKELIQFMEKRKKLFEKSK